MTSYDQLPDDLPVPVDDGAAEHLVGSRVPAVEVQATTGEAVSLATLPGRTVLFVYPRTGTPGQSMPTGWDSIPGARGCTPQACGIRDAHADFTALDARVFGLSTQSTAEQMEVAERLHLPYPLLSDDSMELSLEWGLPTFPVDELTLTRRITIFVLDGLVDGVIYPVFPPDRSAEVAVGWLRERAEPCPSTPDPAPRPPTIAPRGGLPHPIPRPIVR